jgi:hypothetical protein
MCLANYDGEDLRRPRVAQEILVFGVRGLSRDSNTRLFCFPFMPKTICGADAKSVLIPIRVKR